MNEQSPSSRKIIVAVAMAVVVGVGAVMFALHSPHSTSVARVRAVPGAVPQIPDAASSATQAQDAPAAALLQAPDASVTQKDRLDSTVGNTAIPAAGDSNAAAVESTPPVVESKAASDRHVAKAHTGNRTTNRIGPPSVSTADLSAKPTAATVASSVDDGKIVDVPTTPSAPSGTATNAREAAMGTEPVASLSTSTPVAVSNEPISSDTRITTAVKSEIAADSTSNDANVGVTTTNGVVVLTGTLATQDAIDHVKGLAEKVQDVKSVDTSALKIAST